MMLPVHTTLKKWAASIVVDFPTDDIPQLLDERNWKKWGNFLIQRTSFSTNAAPGTTKYEEPLQWMKDVYKQMVNT